MLRRLRLGLKSANIHAVPSPRFPKRRIPVDKRMKLARLPGVESGARTRPARCELPKRMAQLICMLASSRPGSFLQTWVTRARREEPLTSGSRLPPSLRNCATITFDVDTGFGAAALQTGR